MTVTTSPSMRCHHKTTTTMDPSRVICNHKTTTTMDPGKVQPSSTTVDPRNSTSRISTPLSFNPNRTTALSRRLTLNSTTLSHHQTHNKISKMNPSLVGALISATNRRWSNSLFSRSLLLCVQVSKGLPGQWTSSWTSTLWHGRRQKMQKWDTKTICKIR